MAQDKDPKNLNVPPLRFPGFTDEWRETTLSIEADFVKERVSSSNISENYISTENLISNFGGVGIAASIPENTNVIHYHPNDILVSNIRPYLRKVWKANNEGGCSADVFVFRAKEIEPSFLYNVIANDRFINYVMSGAKGVKMPRGDKSQMLKYTFHVPSIVEQKKIGRLIYMLDERITTQNKIIEDYVTLIYSIMKRVFFNDNWQEVRLGEICNRITRKNSNNESNLVLTIAAQYGLVSQTDFFNKSVASDNLSNYFFLQKGDFAYNKSYSGDYTWGAIKRLDLYDTGVLSPLYICFRPKDDIVDSDFLTYLFESRCWYREVAEICVEGARNHGLLNVSVNDFFNMKLLIPTLSEQKDIAKMMTSFSNKIDESRRLLSLYTDQKQYLLNTMFV